MALLIVFFCGDARALPQGISELSSLLDGGEARLDYSARRVIFNSDELAALGALGFSAGELAPRIESGCYSDIACEVRYRFARMSEADSLELKTIASAVVKDCKYIVYGGDRRSFGQWGRLHRLADARQRRSDLIARGSAAARLIGNACVAEADTIAAKALGKLPDDKLSAILASNDVKRIRSLHLIAQHADRSPGFQARSARIFGALNCEIHGANVRQRCAYLADRVSLAFGRAQLYGTQYDCALLDRPDVLEIERRRKAVGLQRLKEYQKCEQS